VQGNNLRKAGKGLVQEVQLLARHLNADAPKLAYITKLTPGAKHGLYEVGGALVMES
jgi:hypothetical protein